MQNTKLPTVCINLYWVVTSSISVANPFSLLYLWPARPPTASPTVGGPRQYNIYPGNLNDAMAVAVRPDVYPDVYPDSIPKADVSFRSRCGRNAVVKNGGKTARRMWGCCKCKPPSCILLSTSGMYMNTLIVSTKITRVPQNTYPVSTEHCQWTESSVTVPRWTWVFQ